MTTNLPEPVNAGLSLPQSVLFTDLEQLRTKTSAELKEIAYEVGRDGGSVFTHLRRVCGLVAWAGWFKFNRLEYIDFIGNLAHDLGVETDTLLKWRQAVVKEEELEVPALVKARSDAAKAGRKTAGQPPSAGQPSSISKPIPATSTEAPAKQSEGVAKDSPAPTPPPLAPSSAGGGSVVGADAPPAGYTEVISDKQGLMWLVSKNDRSVRALGDPYRPAIQANIVRWVEAMGFTLAPQSERRQGYSRPAQPPARGTATTDPFTCAHPKDKRKHLGYIIKCDACGVKIA